MRFNKGSSKQWEEPPCFAPAFARRRKTQKEEEEAGISFVKKSNAGEPALQTAAPYTGLDDISDEEVDYALENVYCDVDEKVRRKFIPANHVLRQSGFNANKAGKQIFISELGDTTVTNEYKVDNRIELLNRDGKTYINGKNLGQPKKRHIEAREYFLKMREDEMESITKLQREWDNLPEEEKKARKERARLAKLDADTRTVAEEVDEIPECYLVKPANKLPRFGAELAVSRDNANIAHRDSYRGRGHHHKRGSHKRASDYDRGKRGYHQSDQTREYGQHYSKGFQPRGQHDIDRGHYQDQYSRDKDYYSARSRFEKTPYSRRGTSPYGGRHDNWQRYYGSQATSESNYSARLEGSKKRSRYDDESSQASQRSRQEIDYSNEPSLFVEYDERIASSFESSIRSLAPSSDVRGAFTSFTPSSIASTGVSLRSNIEIVEDISEWPVLDKYGDMKKKDVGQVTGADAMARWDKVKSLSGTSGRIIGVKLNSPLVRFTEQKIIEEIKGGQIQEIQ